VVGPIDPKAMPVILTKADDMVTPCTAPAEKVFLLQRPADGLVIFTRSTKQDESLAVMHMPMAGDSRCC
jgi:hypothetical protein